MILIARSSFFNINHWSCLSAHDKITVFDFLVILEEYVLQPRLVVPINESVKAELGELQSTRIVQWYTFVLLPFLVPYVCLHVGSCVYRVKLQQGVSCVCSMCGRTLGGCVLAGQRCWWLHPQWLHTESLSPNTTVGSSISLSTQPSIHPSMYLSIYPSMSTCIPFPLPGTRDRLTGKRVCGWITCWRSLKWSRKTSMSTTHVMFTVPIILWRHSSHSCRQVRKQPTHWRDNVTPTMIVLPHWSILINSIWYLNLTDLFLYWS